MKTMTLEEFKTEMKAQGAERIEAVTFRCPQCKTLQSAQDLIDVGAGKNFDEVEGYLAFSCVGRWTEDKGCDWTLGGFLRIHKLEVITPDGERHPSFEIAARRMGVTHRDNYYNEDDHKKVVDVVSELNDERLRKNINENLPRV